VLLRIPKNGNKYVVAFVHAIIFALIFHFSAKQFFNTFEGLLPVQGTNGGKCRTTNPKCNNGLLCINTGNNIYKCKPPT